MSNVPLTNHIGLRIKPDTSGYVLSKEGEIKVDSTLLKIYLDSAIRTLVTTNQAQTLTSKTIVVASNTITTAASGNLAATELNAALAELQGDIDSRATSTDLSNHMSDTSTHGVGEIVGTTEAQTLTTKTIVVASNTVTTAASGNLAATELNAALAELQGDIDTRLSSGALTAHEGDTSTHGVTEIVGTSESQTLTNKTIVAASNTITTAASGNLTSTALDAALAELQGDIDTRALASDLTTHISDTTTHGTTGNIVGTSDTQVITNKDIDGGTAANSRRITLPKDTKANLDALTRKEGTIVYASDENKVYADDGSSLVAIGSGGVGSPDTIFTIDADDFTSTSAFATGDGTITNGAELPGGTLQGTFELISSSPAEGTQHFRYTQAAGSLDSYVFTAAQTIPEIFRGKDVGVNIPAKYDGADNEILFIAFDETNNQVLTQSDFYLKASTTYKNYQVVFSIPSTCTSLRIGFQVKVLNSGKILNFDMISVYDRPFVTSGVNQASDWETYTPTGNWTTNTTYTGKWRRSGEQMEVQARVTLSGAPGGTSAFSVSLPSGYTIDTAKLVATDDNLTFGAGTYHQVGTTQYPLLVKYTSTTAITAYWQSASNAEVRHGGNLTASSPVSAASPYTATISFSVPIVGWTSSVDSVITPARVFPSIKYNSNAGQSITSGADAVIDFEDKVSDSLSLVTTGGSWKFTATESGDYKIAAKIGYASASWSEGNLITVKVTRNGSTISQNSAVAPYTGSYVIARDIDTIVTLSSGDYLQVVTSQTSGGSRSLATSSVDNEVMITRDMSTSLVATPIDRVCYLKDVKTSGTSGGTGTGGSFVTRTLNTLSGDISFLSLSSNQITLLPGTYDLYFTVPAYSVGSHKAKLRNITAGSDEILGTAEYSGAASPAGIASVSMIMGRVTVASTTVFEIQHRIGTSTNSNDLGVNNGMSLSEIYTQGWIKKIK